MNGAANFPTCEIQGCQAEPDVSHGSICHRHLKLMEWADNSNRDDLGIVRFSQELFPDRINSKYGVPEMHKNIYADLLDARTNGKDKMDRLHVIAAPREHSKSTITTFIYVLYCILFGQAKFVVLISESYEKTTQFIRSIKKALASSRVQAYFGDVRAQDAVSEGGKWTESHIVTATGVHILALGMGKSARGLNEDIRPDLIIADDVESENNTKTEESRQGNWNWWKKAVVPAADMILGQVVYIGTMVHYDCILAKLFEQQAEYEPGKGGWRKQFYQVWANDSHTQTIWPEKFPPHLVGKIEREYLADDELGLDQFYAEYLNIAVSPQSRRFSDGVIKLRDFEYRQDDVSGWLYFESRPENDRWVNVDVFIGIDPASSQKSSAKYTGIVAGAVDSKGVVYVLEYVRDRIQLERGPDDTKDGLIDHAVRLAERYRAKGIAIEVTGVGRPIYQRLRNVIKGKAAQSDYWKHPRITPIEAISSTAKEDNIINTLEMPFKNKGIFLRPDMPELVQELQQFPKGRYTDLLDAMCNMMKVKRAPDLIRYSVNYALQQELEIHNPVQAHYRRHRVGKVDWMSRL